MAALALAVLVGMVAGACWLQMQRGPTTQTTHTQVLTPEVPVVLRTPGGVLEVATVRATERFSRRDSKSFWGIDLGETVTEVHVQVTYRFHIPLAHRWPVAMANGVATVDAPAPRPSLPVAFDTATLQGWGRNGWARFNKHDSLLALQQSMTAQLAERAQSAHYRELATEAARRTVAEYVRTWLSTSGQTVQAVHVRFPGEPMAQPPSSMPRTMSP